MKRYIKTVLAFFWIFLFGMSAHITAFAGEVPVSNDEISSQVNEMLSDYDISFSYEDMKLFSLSDLASSLFEAVSARIRAPFCLLGSILVIIVFSSFVKTIGESAFPKSSSERLYNLICVVSSAAIISKPLLTAYGSCETAIQRGSGFMLAFVPIYVGITMVSGGIISAGIYNTVILAAAEIMVQFSEKILMPLLAVMAALSVTGSVFTNASVDSMIKLIKKTVTWTLTLSMTLFSGFVSLKSTLGNTVDGFAAKSAKFVISGFVPVVGSAITDAYSTVKGSFDVMRCTTGTAGTVTVLLLMLPPLLELLAFRAVLWIGTAAAEMFSADSLGKLLKGLESGLAIAMSVLICFSVLFIISTAILMKSV